MPRAQKPGPLAVIPGQFEQTEQKESLATWALVELYGHQRIVGMVTAEPPEFPGMVRVDVPDLLKDGKLIRPGFTRYVGKGALYGVTPCDEETVRRMLPHIDGRPSRPMEFSPSDGYE
jgi:hypothetical protein